jgi:hypothetical protein
VIAVADISGTVYGADDIVVATVRGLPNVVVQKKYHPLGHQSGWTTSRPQGGSYWHATTDLADIRPVRIVGVEPPALIADDDDGHLAVHWPEGAGDYAPIHRDLLSSLVDRANAAAGGGG